MTQTEAQIADNTINKALELLEQDQVTECVEVLVKEIKRLAALTAAAEVDGIDWTDIDAARAVATDATIERCAQVVNDCLIRFQKQHDEDDQFSGIAVAALMADLVAAIRALKEKP